MIITVADKEWDLDFTTEEFFLDKFMTEVTLNNIYHESLSPELRDKPYSIAPYFKSTSRDDPTTNNIWVSISGIIEQIRRNWPPKELLNKDYEGEVMFFYYAKDKTFHKTTLDIKKKEVKKAYETK